MPCGQRKAGVAAVASRPVLLFIVAKLMSARDCVMGLKERRGDEEVDVDGMYLACVYSHATAYPNDLRSVAAECCCR